ncbi:hypothetical protein [Pseudarthrobacter chlorophenolicus]|nr:hypothetical protein [Pseudarthrobacter chlorophenolicus]
MTTSAVLHPQDSPIGGPVAPSFRSDPHASPTPQNIAARAATEALLLARRRTFLQDQLDMVSQQQRALACAAASHHVLERHPDAAVLIFAVKDGRVNRLANVLDGAGRYLPAHRTGEWADAVAAELHQESAGAFAAIEGVEAAGTTLRVNILTVVTGVGHLLSEQPDHQPRHAAFDRTVA